MPDDKQGYEKDYSDDSFWDKILTYAITAGKEVIEKALWLYYASQRPETPAWAKSVIFTALGYFIFPLDAIADPTPAVGFADDLGVLVATVATVAIYINDEVKEKTGQKLAVWFGDRTR